MSGWSLRLRLSLLFAAITLVAMGFIYLAIVPGLETSLVRSKLGDLEQASKTYSAKIERTVGTNQDVRVVNRRVNEAADNANARVTLFGVNNGTEGVQTYAASDSFVSSDLRDLSFATAGEAARTGAPATGTEAGTGGRVGEAARPIFYTRDGRRRVGYVLVYSAPLRDAERSVAVVRRRVLVATAIALLLGLIAGTVLARQLTRRVRRLESTAARVAQGDFDTRFPVDRGDEIGQLSRTLDDMRRQLAELDSARKRFIATASHELRTPIFSIGGYLELLQDEELDAETRDRFLTQVREQVERLGRLATELLDLSRLEAGSLELRSERVDLRDVARLVASEFEPRLQVHASNLELRLPATGVPANCDQERVAQVVRILIDNALTHTPPGTDVVLTAGRRDGRARIGVGDFGPGIHRTMLPHIFEPFFTSDDAQGSGLGLAIAGELAERMAGELVVESQPGRTTFTLEIPA